MRSGRATLLLRRCLCTGSAPPLPAALEPLGLKYLEEDALRDLFGDEPLGARDAQRLLASCGSPSSDADAAAVVEEMAPGADAVPWSTFKAAVDAAALPIDQRVLPISGSLVLNFTGQGIMLPVLPVLARSLGLAAAEIGVVTAASAGARLVLGIPAAKIAERVGRRPLLIAGPAIGAVAMCGMGLSTSFEHLVLCNALGGVGSALIVAGAGLYLADISTPRNRAQTNAPLMVSALLGFAVGPAIGGVLAESFGLHAPFIACATGMGLAASAAYATLPETMRAQPAAAALLRRGAAQRQLDAADSADAAETAAARLAKADADALAGATSAAPAADAAGGGSDAREGTWRSSAGATARAWKSLLDRPQLVGINAAVVMTGFGQGAAPVTGVLFATEHLDMSTSEVRERSPPALSPARRGCIRGARLRPTSLRPCLPAPLLLLLHCARPTIASATHVRSTTARSRLRSRPHARPPASAPRAQRRIVCRAVLSRRRRAHAAARTPRSSALCTASACLRWRSS